MLSKYLIPFLRQLKMSGFNNMIPWILVGISLTTFLFLFIHVHKTTRKRNY